MVFATFWHVQLPFCTVFAIFLALRLQPLILHGICYMLVVQTFMRVSLGMFRVGYPYGFSRDSFRFRVSLGFLQGFFRVSFAVSLAFHFGFI
jgi:hypothetical protein